MDAIQKGSSAADPAGQRPENVMEVSTECSDEQLMALLCEGNTNALALLVERYQNDIFRFCIHYLRDLEAARDAAQDIFLKVFAAKDKFDTSRSFRPWLLRIARNLCFNLLKRSQIVPMESLDAMQEKEGGSRQYWKAQTSAHPLEGILASERRRVLLRIVDTMPEDMREVIVLKYFEQMSSKEIADVLEITEGAARTRIHRAIAWLRTKNKLITDLQ